MKVELESLVAQKDIAARLHISSHAVNNWITRFPGFPKEVARFGNTPVYLWEDVVTWHIEQFGSKRHFQMLAAG